MFYNCDQNNILHMIIGIAFLNQEFIFVFSFSIDKTFKKPVNVRSKNTPQMYQSVELIKNGTITF